MAPRWYWRAARYAQDGPTTAPRGPQDASQTENCSGMRDLFSDSRAGMLLLEASSGLFAVRVPSRRYFGVGWKVLSCCPGALFAASVFHKSCSRLSTVRILQHLATSSVCCYPFFYSDLWTLQNWLNMGAKAEQESNMPPLDIAVEALTISFLGPSESLFRSKMGPDGSRGHVVCKRLQDVCQESSSE